MHALPERITIAGVDRDERVAATLQLLTSVLERAGHEVRPIRVGSGLPRRLGRDHKRTWKSFTATPAPLRESWRVARHLATAVAPGEAVLLTDRAGVAGMFALEQAMGPAAQRRHVLIAAADGTLLAHEAVTGTPGGLHDDLESEVDWELVAYRNAGAVLATSQLAADRLAGHGIEAHLITTPDEPVVPRPPIGVTVYLPEPVSRLAGTPAALRGLSGLLDRRPDLEITLSPDDRIDIIFEGSTWQALAGVRAMLGERVQRGRHPAPDIVVLGDPFAVPSDEVRALRAAGVPVVVAAGSVAAAQWPEAPTWSTEEELVAAIVDPTPPPAPVVTLPSLRTTQPAPDRAGRVSAAVPIFRNHRYLDDCVESLLAQTQPLHEIVLVDDGSRSPEVDAAVDRWCDAHPELIRATRRPNRGVCAARNAAIESMTGDAFVLVDADDTLHPRFVAACTAALRNDRGLWAVATWTRFHGTYEGIEAKPPFDARVGRRENPIVSTSVLVDMAVRDRGIRFVPDLAFLYCEDWDLWAQIISAGGRFGLVPEPLAMHRVHPESGGFQRTAMAHAVGKARATARLRRL